MQEVLLSAPAAVGGDDAKLTAAMEAVAALAGGDPDSDGYVAGNSAAGRMLKTLALGRRYDRAAEAAVEVEVKQEDGDKEAEKEAICWRRGVCWGLRRGRRR